MSISSEKVRVLGLLLGDITDTQSDAPIKYGHLFAALSDVCDLVDVHNVELQRVDRYHAALRAVRWPPSRWREAFYKSAWAFAQRSRRIGTIVEQYKHQADVVFQHGALFSAGRNQNTLPVVLYTDFTYRLARTEDPWRVPFSAAEDRRWDALELQAYREAAFILTRSAYTRSSIVDDYGIDPDKVAVVGGGVNFAPFPAPEPLSSVPRILFVGKDFERKGGALLLAAFQQVRARVPNAELWLVTSRSDISVPGVRLIAPVYDRAVMADLYRSCSIFVMPSLCETWGDVFLEAMAYGLPCIGSTRDAMPEIIIHGQTGYVIDISDVSGLVHYLELLLRHPELCAQMGIAGRERALQHFTWRHVVERIAPYLEEAALMRDSRRVMV